MNPFPKEKLKTFVARIPKIELHLHLEGAISPDTLLELISRSTLEDSVKNMNDLQDKLSYRNFAHFIETWIWKNQFIRDARDFEKIGYNVLRDLSQQNIKYVEAFYSPGDFEKQELSIKDITLNLLKAAQQAQSDFGIQCRYIIDLVRDDGPKAGMQRLDEVTPFLDQGVIGIGLGGSEQDYPAIDWIDVYKEARKRGFRLTAHAGEVAGPESVWSVINDLKVERVGHGLRSSEDPNLVAHLAETKIPLEMCPISNLKTGVVSSLSDHPIMKFLEQDIMVTINSDDPTLFNTSLTQEFNALIDELDVSLDDIKKLTLNAIESSFMTNDEKKKFLLEFETEFEDDLPPEN